MGTMDLPMAFNLWSNDVLIICILSIIINTTQGTSYNTVQARLLSQPSSLQRSVTSTADIKSLLFALEEKKHFSAELIFDKKYQEKSTTLLKTFSNEITGLMYYQFDSSVETINTLIKSGTPGTNIITLCTFDNVLNIFRQINVTRLKSHFVNWILILETEEAKMESLDILQSLIFEGTKVTVVTEEEDGLFSIFSANVEVDGIMRFRYKGQWGSSVPDKKSSLEPLFNPGQYKDMYGRLVAIAGIHDPPYFALGDQLPDGSFPPVGGLDWEIIKAISKVMNFTYKVITPADGGWGYPQPDGTITGMIGMVARREVYFAVTGIAMNAKRTPVIDYASYYNFTFMTIFSRAPKLLNRAMAILSPFPLDVWIYLFLTVLSIGPVLKIQSVISKKSNDSVLSWKLHVYSFNMFRNLVIQGNLLSTSHWPHRILFFTWYFFCLIVAAIYSGTLTAVLAVPSFEKPINYLEELPEAVANGFYLTVNADTTNEHLFKEATGGILKQTWELFNHEDRSQSFLYDSELAFRLILEEKSIHFSPDLNGDIYTRKLGFSKFHFSKERFFPQFVGFALPPGAPYKEAFDRVIQNLLKGGFIVKWKYDEIFKMGNEVSKESSSLIGAFTLNHLQGAFSVCLLGFLTAMAVLILEILYWNISNDKVLV